MEKIKLYNGEIELSFDEQKHIYYVNDKPVQGVTNVLKTINKPALLPWAVNQAIGSIKKNLKAGRSYDEIEIEEMITEAKRAYRKTSDRAATIGDKVHKWIEVYIKENKVEEIINQEMQNAVDQFMSFIKINKVTFKASEQKVYSKKHKYAGTFDGIVDVNLATGEIPSGTYLMDIKTSKDIYPEYWLQLGAYSQALMEEKPKERIDGSLIVKCGKDGSLDVQYHRAMELADDRETFKSLLQVSKWLSK